MSKVEIVVAIYDFVVLVVLGISLVWRRSVSHEARGVINALAFIAIVTSAMTLVYRDTGDVFKSFLFSMVVLAILFGPASIIGFVRKLF